MKKSVIGACMAVALLLGATSCGCGDKCTVNNDSIVAAELSDSINTHLGMYAGMDFANRLTMSEKEGIAVDRKEFVKGLKFAVSRKFDVYFSEGVMSGLQMSMTIDQLKKEGVEINRDEILRQARKFIMNDEVKLMEMNAAQFDFEKLMTRLESLGDKTVTPELNDSINVSLGMYVGMDLGRRLSVSVQSITKANRQEFAKGFQYIVGQDYDLSYRDGVQNGLNVARTMDHFRELGVDTDSNIVLGELTKYVTTDSIDMNKMKEVQMTYEGLMRKLGAINDNRNRMRAGLEPENTAAASAANQAQTYYDREMTPGNTITIDTGDGNTMSAIVKQSPSGLIYAIFDEGTGEKIGQQTLAKIQYRGMHADGSIFDSGENTFAPMNVIPGFGEGLMMLGEGGMAMLRIPGELGYGANGIPEANIAPNETLYFMVAVIDIQ